MNRISKNINKLVKNKRGFTLVEVVVAIALLGILLPLTYELFILGAGLMNKSVNMISVSGDVTYTLDSNKGANGVSIDAGTTGVPLAGTITVKYDNLTPNDINDDLSGINGVSEVEYQSGKKGEVIYYTYVSNSDGYSYGTNILQGNLKSADSNYLFDDQYIAGWSVTGAGTLGDTRKDISSSAIPISAGAQYSFSCIYYTSNAVTLDDVYLQFNASGYPEGSVYCQPTLAGHATNIINKDLGGGWWKRSGIFTTTTNTTEISRVFFDSDTQGLTVFIAEVKIAKVI